MLDSLGEVSVTLAAFAAVFRAFAAGSDPDGHSKARLNAVIEGGLLLAFISFLPSALLSASLTEKGAYRLSSGVGSAWALLRGTVPAFSVIRSGWPPPALFPLALALHLAALVPFVLGVLAVGPLGSIAAHEVGCVALFGWIAVVFLAQFRVERA
jgi:hypothetical protein